MVKKESERRMTEGRKEGCRRYGRDGKRRGKK